MVILSLGELLAVGVFASNLPAQTVFTTAMVATKLLIGIQAHDQQSFKFAGLKGLAPFELAVDPGRAPAQLFRVQALAHVSKGVMTDRILVSHPALPLWQLGFGFQLQETGD